MTTFANPKQLNAISPSALTENEQWEIITLGSLETNGVRLWDYANDLGNPIFKSLVHRFINEVGSMIRSEASIPPVEIFQMVQVCDHLSTYANSRSQNSIDAAEDILDSI